MRKEANNPAFIQYKSARSAFQFQYKREQEFQSIRRNNIIMQANNTNSRKYFRIIKALRSSKKESFPTVLKTPAGDFYGSDALEGFTVEAELLGKPHQMTAEFDNEFYKICAMDNCYIF